jgi:hypothetical protein
LGAHETTIPRAAARRKFPARHHPPPRSEAQRGRGTARSAVEGAWASKSLRRHSNDGVGRFIHATRQFACGDVHRCHAARLEPRALGGGRVVAECP